MNARTNPKKIPKNLKEKDKKLINKSLASVEINEITIHTSEEDISIVDDEIEANQPILVENDDSKPSKTSTPKRKAAEDQGPPKKKPTLEDDSDQNDDGLALDAVEEEAKEIRSREGKRVEGQFGMNDKLKRSMEVYMEKWMAGMTRRLDTLEKSKQRKDEEKGQLLRLVNNKRKKDVSQKENQSR